MLGLEPMCVRAARCPCVVHPFLCVGRCERLCHSPKACTPSTLARQLLTGSHLGRSVGGGGGQGLRDGCARAVSHDARVSHATAFCAARALSARPLACLGLSPCVCARRSVSVCCPPFFCVWGAVSGSVTRQRACTPSTPSLRETSPHQPPHTADLHG